MSPELLTAYQSAQFGKAARMRMWLFIAQLLVAVPAAVSVVVENGRELYWLALIGALLVILYWGLQAAYRRSREGAQAARRAGLISNGLGISYSAAEVRDLRQKFVVTEGVAFACRDPDYYASELPPGYGRLAELVEESAFYTAHLQAKSAIVMRVIIVCFLVAFAIIAFVGLPYTATDTMMVVVRIAMAFLVFVLSTDVFGAMVAHKHAAADSKEIYMRLSRARAAKFPESDVLLALSDYNAVIEAAPEVVPYVYGFCRTGLDQRWREYQRDAARSEAE